MSRPAAYLRVRPVCQYPSWQYPGHRHCDGNEYLVQGLSRFRPPESNRQSGAEKVRQRRASRSLHHSQSFPPDPCHKARRLRRYHEGAHSLPPPGTHVLVMTEPVDLTGPGAAGHSAGGPSRPAVRRLRVRRRSSGCGRHAGRRRIRRGRVARSRPSRHQRRRRAPQRPCAIVRGTAGWRDR
jgi:hypothetical protein